MREQSAYGPVSQYIERVTRAVSLSLFEIIVSLSHSVGGMRQTQRPNTRNPGESVKRYGLHLDGKDPLLACSYHLGSTCAAKPYARRSYAATGWLCASRPAKVA